MRGFAITSSAMRISHCCRRHRTACIVLGYAGLAALLAIPVLVARVPLGADDLNHLARIYVRAHIGTDPDLARLFELRAGMFPSLGMDLLLTPLARVLPIMIVGRIYILALVWGLVGAVVVTAACVHFARRAWPFGYRPDRLQRPGCVGPDQLYARFDPGPPGLCGMAFPTRATLANPLAIVHQRCNLPVFDTSAGTCAVWHYSY